ncbi:autotransporter outer membrane beta-barrel domain-containing protein [Variovorax sp. KBW07]|uniref:autotransporter outer membrane beta-barrel domain-containing protein n=1 Tax=Variovorax sp. KBW07 TaxID=2153358 RepID=UPI000F566922|nr:autotransporter outer membrane beta-barrel domain-containing protein [Variovorax sp. KBW07]RQO41182.1 autotransporter outer membrane beta-barrel domain-containing protein [Variovorax sp. KBW07]
MNRVYRLVFNRARGMLQAVPEIAQASGGSVSGTARGARRRLVARRGRIAAMRAAVLALAITMPAGAVLAQTRPSGGSIFTGNGSINMPSAGVLSVVQTSPFLGMSWGSFDVGAGGQVSFDQPLASSTALNEIASGLLTGIDGSIRSNGRVFITNPDGIVARSGATLATGSLLLTSLGITRVGISDNYRLESGNAPLAIIFNSGEITAASGGSVALVGRAVRNGNRIVAAGGRIELTAASRAELVADSLGRAVVTIAANGALQGSQDATLPAVENTGTLQADDGMIVLQAQAAPGVFARLVGNSGTVQARSTSANTIGSVTLSASGGAVVTSATSVIDVSGVRGGQVALYSNTGVSVGGSINATGTTSGGAISMEGGPIDFASGHRVDAGSGVIRLSSSGAITQAVGTGAILGGTLRGNSGGKTSLDGNNAIGDLNGFSAAGFSLTNARALSVSGSLDGQASVALTVNGGLTLGGDVSGRDMVLDAMGAIVQVSGTLTADKLRGNSAGNATLGNPNNQIAEVAYFYSAGALSLNTGRALTISGDVLARTFTLDAANGTVVTGSVETRDTSGSGTTVRAGTLQIGDGGSQGSISGDVKLDTQLIFKRNDAVSFAGSVSGAGSLTQSGSGTLTLTGASTYSGGTTVAAGTLRVNNTTGSATGSGTVQVDSGAALGGGGTIAGAVQVADGGMLSPGNSPGTLTLGALSLGSGAILNYELGQAGAPGGALNDLIDVKGNLVLGGKLNVAESAGGNFGPGLYRLIKYAGLLTGNGLAFGTLPTSATAADLHVQTSVTGEINLINSKGASLDFWDGSDPGKYNDGAAGGGSGTWRLGSPHDGWADAEGKLNASWKQDGFAMFGGKAGTVTVDNGGGNVSIGGAQFFADGYVVGGNALTLGLANTVVKVGDGTASGAGMKATIDAVLTGTGGLVKDDMGTLVLKGANNYTGGTQVKAGVLQGNTTSLRGNIVNDAVVTFDQPVDGSFAGMMSGTGSLRKIGGGELLITTANSYGGGTLIDEGTVNTAVTGALGSGNVRVAGGAGLVFSGNADPGSLTITTAPRGNGARGGFVAFAGSGSAARTAFVNDADGTLDITGVTAGGMAIGSLAGGGRVLLGGKVLTTGTLDTSTEVSGVISGAGGSLVKVGTGALTLSGANTYTGGTALRQGRLNVGHSQALGTGTLTMDDDTTLGFSANGVTIANAIKLTGNNDPIIDTGAFDGALNGGISGGGFITKQGTGTLTLSGSNTYTGATNVAQGTLKAGAVNTLSAVSAHSVAAGATLDLAGFNQSVASLANSGTVSLVSGTPGSTLTVNGPYVGNNGVLKLGAALNGSGPSDRLVLDGATAVASGKTTVQITNIGGLGALTSGNGIEVITAQNGATTTAQTTKDAFSLAGGHVDAGAYEYRLNAGEASGAGENWYLRSTAHSGSSAVVAYRREAALYAALPNQLRQGNLAMLGDVRKRVGDDDVKGTATAPTGSDRRAWARVLSTDIDIQQGGAVSPTSKGRLTGFQAGTDLLATSNWRAGIYVGQLDGDARVNGFASGIRNLGVGRNDLRSQYVGVYGTYTSDSGFYADAVVQSGRHRYTVEPSFGAGVGGKGNSLLGSIEVGQSFAIGNSGWSVEPQLQLIHQHLDLGNSLISGAVVQPQADNGWIVRAGVRVKGQMDTGVGTLQPYGRFNVYKTSSGMDVARFTTGTTTTDIGAPTGGTSTELAGGFTLALSQTTSLYGEVGKLWSSGGDAKVKSGINGSLGVRVKW